VSILQFIYLGETTIDHERMNEFLNVAKNLDIQEVGKNFVDQDEEIDHINDKKDINLEDQIKSDENGSFTMNSKTSSNKTNNDKKPFKCHHCNYEAIFKYHLKQHLLCKHEGIPYPCQQCDY